MLLGRRVTWVTSVNSLRPSLLLPGASCFPSTVPRSHSPSPPDTLAPWRAVPNAPLGLTRTVAPAVDFPVTVPDGRHKVLCRKAAMVPAPFSFVPLSRFFQTVWCSVCKSIILRIAFVNIFVNILVLSLIIFNIFMTWL